MNSMNSSLPMGSIIHSSKELVLAALKQGAANRSQQVHSNSSKKLEIVKAEEPAEHQISVGKNTVKVLTKLSFQDFIQA